MDQSPKFKTFLAPPKGTAFSYPVLDVPQEIAEAMLGTKNKLRVVLHFDNGVKKHRALQRSKNGETFITLGKAALKDAKKEVGQEVEVYLSKDTSEYGMPMPEELAEVLRQDEEGKQKFDALTPGMKRSFLYFINSAKTTDTRINRALKLTERLKHGRIVNGRIED